MPDTSKIKDNECPCGSRFLFTDCCGPLLRGSGYADTAEDLMRSRYVAHVKGDDAYLARTMHPKDDSAKSQEGAVDDGANWRRLEILDTQGGGAGDTEGEVAFTAVFEAGGIEKEHREVSKFKKFKGRWYYCPGESKITPGAGGEKKAQKPAVRAGAKVGRNDPCPCGSGKKYKKCCGKC